MTNNLTKTVPLESFSIENYKVVELIGSGGMANIYKAIQLSLDRPIALKIMHQHLTVDEGFVARFEKEAKQAAQLQHENIVSIIDYGSDEGVYFIAMEHIDGKNLREILERQKRLPLEICLLVSHQIAEGLKYAHAHNLIHRDIKPSNIILSNDGRVMLTDFGIAKGCDDLTITGTGQMIGSPAYMSPEQAAGRPMDHRSDIFSLGIIMYEIICGEKPFKGETYQEMVASIMSKEPESMQKLRVDVNTEIEEQVKKALVKDVDSRYQSVEELADRIYTEMQRYKIPPVKKLISSFLSNPIKITTKLRSDKISNHMESALYYVTMGEGRLKEAKKEFQEVLRYDKNNKAAREYLKKLEARENRSESTSLTKRPIKIRKWHILSAAGVGAALLAVLLTKVLLGIKYNTETVQNLLRSGVGPSDSALVLADKDNQALTDSDNINNDKTLKSTKGSDKSKKSPSTDTGRKTDTIKKKPAVNKKPPSTQRQSGGSSYPHQDLKEFGTLSVKTNVSAYVFIDKINYGRSNGPPIKLSPGRHFVEVEADGYRKMTRRIFTEEDKQVDIEITLIAD
ncbi:MAG: protein kinase [Candidatus Zixiibacteriota bacterium]|nr:MAG: protein kinase [candidate division Zixibacteria bacterium]